MLIERTRRRLNRTSKTGIRKQGSEDEQEAKKLPDLQVGVNRRNYQKRPIELALSRVRGSANIWPSCLFGLA